MNRTQMLLSFGSLLTAFMIIGVLFIIVGLSPHNDMTIRIIFSVMGIILLVTTVSGFNSLRRLQYG